MYNIEKIGEISLIENDLDPVKRAVLRVIGNYVPEEYGGIADYATWNDGTISIYCDGDDTNDGAYIGLHWEKFSQTASAVILTAIQKEVIDALA